MNMHPHWHQGPARVPPSRSIVKTITYRIVSMASTGGLAWAIFGAWAIAGAFAVVDAVLNTVLYYGHERLWAHVDLHQARRGARTSADKREIGCASDYDDTKAGFTGQLNPPRKPRERRWDVV